MARLYLGCRGGWTYGGVRGQNTGHMTVTYRRWSDGDEVAARAAFGRPDTPQAELDRTLLGPDAQAPWRRTLVAEGPGGEFLGAAALAEAGLHPQRLWSYVEVAPPHRRRGIGTELLRRLQQADPPSGVRALRARFTSAAEAAEGFTAGLGMRPIQHTRIVRIPAGGLPEPMLTPTGPAMEDLATGSVELTKVVARFYDHVHESWDPSQMSLGQAQDLLLAPQTGAHGAIVLRDRPKDQGGRILAFAVSYPQAPADPDEAERGRRATTGDQDGNDTELLIGHDPELPHDRARAAVQHLLALTAARHPVRVEVDEAMVALTEVLDALLSEQLAEVVTRSTLVATH